MSAAFSLPVLTLENLTAFPPRIAPRGSGLPRLERMARQGALLHAGPMSGDGEVLSLNLTRGCAHRCAFCSARAYPTYPGDEVVYLFENSGERLAAELSARKKKPKAVYLSPSTDPFMPLAEVQAETARTVQVLAEHGVQSWLMTRGYIRRAVREILVRHRELVKVTIGLVTMDRALQRRLEPLAASPRLRLRQIARLRERDLRVQVELGPLVPGLTDTRANLEPLLRALAAAGVRNVTASYLFLRPGIQENLGHVLEGPARQALLEAFAAGPMLQGGTIAAARYLPKPRRQRGYAALMALAAEVGITIHICGLTNPDFVAASRPAEPEKPKQRLLQF